MKTVLNYISIDLESWASPNLPEYIGLTSPEKKALDNGHIKASALQILKLLKKHNVKLTFFIVGQLYDWYPEIVERIASEGHEIGYHTHSHDDVTSKVNLLHSLQQSKKFIQRFKPIGFRAPRISFQNNHLHVLKNYGFKYDSSSYGPFSKKRKIDGVLEIPVTSISKVPMGSGYFMGALGKNIEFVYRNLNNKEIPVISFIHNWQILRPKNPTFPSTGYVLSHPFYIPYLLNCHDTFEYLISRFSFTKMKNLVK